MGSGKSGKKQARAIAEEGQREEQRARLQAQAAQMQQESMINRQRATEAAQAAQDNLIKQEVEVEQAPVEDVEMLDENGRRRAPRESYRIRDDRTSSIRI